jgi:hypothetical protein
MTFRLCISTLTHRLVNIAERRASDGIMTGCVCVVGEGLVGGEGRVQECPEKPPPPLPTHPPTHLPTHPPNGPIFPTGVQAAYVKLSEQEFLPESMGQGSGVSRVWSN